MPPQAVLRAVNGSPVYIYAELSTQLSGLSPEKAEFMTPLVDALLETIAEAERLQTFVVEADMGREFDVAQQLQELCADLFGALSMPQKPAIVRRFTRSIMQVNALQTLQRENLGAVALTDGTHERLHSPLNLLHRYVLFVHGKLQRAHKQLGAAGLSNIIAINTTA